MDCVPLKCKKNIFQNFLKHKNNFEKWVYDILKSGGFLQLAPDFWAGRGTIAPSVNPLLCAEKKCNAFFVCTLEIEIYTSSWVQLKSNVGDFELVLHLFE